MTELMLNKSLDPGGVRQILSPRSPLSSTQTLNAHSRGRGNCTRGHETVQLWRPRGASGLLAPAVCRLRMLKQPHWIPLWSVTVKLLVFQTWTSDWLEWCIFSLFSRQLNSSFYFHTRHQAGCKLASSVTRSLKRRQMLTLSFPKWPYFQPLDSVFEIFSGLGHQCMERHWKHGGETSIFATRGNHLLLLLLLLSLWPPRPMLCLHIDFGLRDTVALARAGDVGSHFTKWRLVTAAVMQEMVSFGTWERFAQLKYELGYIFSF